MYEDSLFDDVGDKSLEKKEVPTKILSPRPEEVEYDREKDKNLGKDKGDQGKEDKTKEAHVVQDLGVDSSSKQQGGITQGEQLSDSTTHSWLDEELRSKQIVIDDSTPNWDDLLANIGKGKAKKKAKIIPRVGRDEANNRVIHIATPAPDKNKDEVTRQDYSVQRINLGPTSMIQEF